MSYQSTADKHCDDAKKCLSDAIDHLHQVVLVRCEGSEDLDKQYLKKLNELYFAIAQAYAEFKL